MSPSAVCGSINSRSPLVNSNGEATFFWKSRPDRDAPDLQTIQAEIPICSPETAERFNPPADSWTLVAGVVRPKSQGRVRLSGPNPQDPIRIEANTLSHPDDLEAAIACVELCREIGNSTDGRHVRRSCGDRLQTIPAT